MKPISKMHQWDEKELAEQIRVRIEIKAQLVGWLYPGILMDEIVTLRERYHAVTGRFDYP